MSVEMTQPAQNPYASISCAYEADKASSFEMSSPSRPEYTLTKTWSRHSVIVTLDYRE